MRQYMDDKGSVPKIAEIHNQLKEVSEGLRFVHAEGFIHRDIKPDNIFIVGAPPGVAKLGDFGLSCKTSPIQPGLNVPNTVQEVEVRPCSELQHPGSPSFMIFSHIDESRRIFQHFPLGLLLPDRGV